MSNGLLIAGVIFHFVYKFYTQIIEVFAARTASLKTMAEQNAHTTWDILGVDLGGIVTTHIKVDEEIATWHGYHALTFKSSNVTDTQFLTEETTEGRFPVNIRPLPSLLLTPENIKFETEQQSGRKTGDLRH